MPKPRTHFEQVPLEMVRKIAEIEVPQIRITEHSEEVAKEKQEGGSAGFERSQRRGGKA